LNCIDCGKQLGSAAKSHGTKRCSKCFAATRKLPEVFCVDCGTQLAPSAKYHKAKRCRGCQTRRTWTGRHHSDEARKKIREHCSAVRPDVKEKNRLAHIGKIQSPEAREKNRIANSGSNNARWRGGLATERAKIQGSAEYKAWRKSVFGRDDYTCRICLKRGGSLHAHHALSFSKYPKFRTHLSNGTTLCLPCHQIIHRRLHQ
jgi:hypothetical protein